MALGAELQAASRTGHFTTGNRNHGTQNMCALRVFPLGFAGDPSELGNPFFRETGRGPIYQGL
jgi:hypothetical protein